MRIALLVLLGVCLPGCAPEDHRMRHAIYLKDTAGDCVALWVNGSRGMPATVVAQHVDAGLCGASR